MIRPGEPVVVDIGGTMPSGYCSDSTRTYAVGEAPADFRAYYAVLQEAQAAACAAVRPGVTPEAVDAAARRAFRRYWLVVGPFSGLVRRRWLLAAARSLE